MYSHFVALASGKTGSSTLTVSFNAYHTHGTEFETRTNTKYGTMENIYKEIRLKYNKKPIIVGSVREPIGRHVSTFFQNITKYLSLEEANEMTIDELITYYKINNKHGIYNPYYPKENADLDMMGVDILLVPFDHDKKVLKYENESLKIYIFRFEDIKNWPIIIKNALDPDDVPYFKYNTSNLSDDKPYNELYKKFKESYKLTSEEIDKIFDLEKDLIQHFYTSDEIEKMKNVWLIKQIE